MSWGAWWLIGRVLDYGTRGCRLEPHRSHCVESLSKTLNPLLSTGSTQEDPSQHDWKTVYWDVKNQNQTKVLWVLCKNLQFGLMEHGRDIVIKHTCSCMCYSELFLKLEFYIKMSKTCLKLPSKKTKIGSQDRLSLNAGQKYCRMLQESILQYFQPSLSYHLSSIPFVCLFLSGH